MARPIAATPKLDQESTKIFLMSVERGLSDPMGPIATPNINRAIEMVLKDATKRPQCNPE